MATDQPLTFGQLLRRARRSAGLTQEVLAEQAGISVRTVSDLERGLHHRPHRDTVRLLADALGLTAEDRRLWQSAGERGPASIPVPRVDEGMVQPLTTGSSASEGQRAPAGPGVLTFLIADIRGYTRFTQERGDEAAGRLTTRFAEVLGEMVSARGGSVTELRGDEALAVFESTRSALHAAIELQDRFTREVERDASLPLLVGIGLDAGEVVRVAEGYRGRALNVAARLCGLAGPGEVLATETVSRLAGHVEGIVYLQRGKAELKGLVDPVEILQAVREETVPAAVLPFSVHTTPPTNLPAEPNLFIGREKEIADVRALMSREDVRLLTLTGPGGTGKTRLVLHVASMVREDYADGVFLVSLASLSDPDLVPSAIAAALGVKEVGGQPVVQILIQHLQAKQVLLILDNFEHLPDAATSVAKLLVSCPGVKILTTSRAPLHLAAEHEFAVPPLSLPERGRVLPADRFSQYDAVALFVGRAQAVKADFTLTDENAAAVAEICRRLDGLPLAIELAAARIRLFPPHALLRRLSSRLRLLTGGTRDLPARQQTLRDTIDWSYDLLTAREQRLFGRLAVFAGGCGLEAVEAVCDAENDLGMELVDGMASLVGQSLLHQEEGLGGEPRFHMLETIREYALERLEASGDAEAVRRHHAEYYMTLAEEAQRELTGANQGLWLDRLEAEHDNLRAALGWSLERDQEGDIAPRLAAALWRFWKVRGHFSEGSRWLEAVLAESSAMPVALQARVVTGAGNLLLSQGDYVGAASLYEKGLALRQELNDAAGVAGSLSNLGLATLFQGQYARAKALHEESLALRRELGDRWGVATSLASLGIVALFQSEYDRAAALFEECLQLWSDIGDNDMIALALHNLGHAALGQGDAGRAIALQEESLALFSNLGDKEGIAWCLEGLGSATAAQREARWAARLWGAAEALRENIGTSMSPSDRAMHERHFALALRQIAEAEFTGAWEEGRTMPLEQVLVWCVSRLSAPAHS